MVWLIIILFFIYLVLKKKGTERSRENIYRRIINTQRRVPERTKEKNNTSIKKLDLCPVEYLEFPKLNDNGKVLFLDNEGNGNSTEEIVQKHFKKLGYKIVRGEVQFWQAMYGLAFWDEIFQGEDIEFSLNDIPLDYYSGKAFYESRRQIIEEKTSFLSKTSIYEYIWMKRVFIRCQQPI